MALDLEVGVEEDASEEESRESIVVSPANVPVVVVIETSDKGMEGELASEPSVCVGKGWQKGCGKGRRKGKGKYKGRKRGREGKGNGRGKFP